MAQGASVGAKILADAGITLDKAQTALSAVPITVNNFTPGIMTKSLSETAKLTLKMSWDIAQEFRQEYLGTEHILYSLLSQKNARATVLLKDMNVDISYPGISIFSGFFTPFEVESYPLTLFV